MARWFRSIGLIAGSLLFLAAAGATAAPAAQVFSDQPNAVEFPVEEAKFIRLMVLQTTPAGQPCIDELEIYGPAGEANLALAETGARATASSCLAGYAEHAIGHLNDGNYGNDKSWIAAGAGVEWAQIELPAPAQVSKVVYSRDRNRFFADRMPTSVEVLVSMDGKDWKSAGKLAAEAGPVVLASRPDDAGALVPSPPPPPKAANIHGTPESDPLKEAFLTEEYAWIKTAGRADVDPRLVPYNGRVKEYPRHVGDDVLPLPPVFAPPELDETLNDSCWDDASRGTVRVAHPFDFNAVPLVASDLWACRHDGMVWFALRTDRLLSSHVAVVSSADMGGCGVVELKDGALVFNQYKSKNGRLAVDTSLPVRGSFDKSLTKFKFGLPLSLFPGCDKQGLRVGLGMGGRYTGPLGRPILFKFSSLGIRYKDFSANGAFWVGFSLPEEADPVTVQVTPKCEGTEIALTGGMGVAALIPATTGPVGPEATLRVTEGANEYTLHLLRYDPLDHTIAQMEDMAARLEKQGLDVSAERNAVAGFRETQKRLITTPVPDLSKERSAFYEMRLAKRNLFLRAPDLEPARDILFVKHHAFEPSHNYSDYFDSAFRGGGGVYVARIPEANGRLAPESAQLTELFNSGKGIARNPMADFDLNRVYFSHRDPKDGYYHVMSVKSDGTGLKQITSGPFQDLWPCPLPDGDLAVISSRCTARFICWRPQASTLFRMKPDGGEFQPLSFANLTEWAPSVMDDGRLIWTRSEYQDKGADFGHTLWAIRPDGSQAELVFGNDIIQPNGYANGRPVPETKEFVCTLISHFGDLNGPIALVNPVMGRSNPGAITSLTPEVPRPGMWPDKECFREPVPLSRDYFLCAHAPRGTFGIYVIDRFGNREMLYMDPDISSMCPTVFRKRPHPPVLARPAETVAEETGEFVLKDVYQGISPQVPRGSVKYIRVVEEVRAVLDALPNGEFRKDHPEFQDWYATPVHKVSGPFGWPTYVAKAPHGLVPVEPDGSARFNAPAGRVLYFEALDENFNELQRMRSVVQLQPGERRGCIGCHESRLAAPANSGRPAAKELHAPVLASWEGRPFSYERVVQPVLDAHCVSCHNAAHKGGVDLRGDLDPEKVPVSYRTLIERGLVHYADMGWNSGGTEKLPPLSLGTIKSKLWDTLNAGHHDVALTTDEMLRIKTWIDLNCPLWPDYKNRVERPAGRTFGMAGL